MEIRQLKEELPRYTEEINNLMYQLSPKYTSQNEDDFLKLAQNERK